mgnify:CR=1 FL=1
METQDICENCNCECNKKIKEYLLNYLSENEITYESAIIVFCDLILDFKKLSEKESKQSPLFKQNISRLLNNFIKELKTEDEKIWKLQ